jgi:L-methionine (R)-S-oxide reductase
MQMKNKEILGAILALVGLLFLLVSNGVLWFGWNAVWPLFLLLTGGLLLKVFSDKRGPEQLFGGLMSIFLGFFFLLFTAGVRPWEAMVRLWPTFPMMTGISLLAMAAVKKHSTGTFVSGILAVILSIACYSYTAGAVSRSVAAPFVRLWPLVLIASGVILYLRAGREPAAEGDIPIELTDEPADFLLETGIEAALAGARGSDQIIRRAVEYLKDADSKYTWVGIYRREGEMLVLDPNHYRGADPEHKRIRIPEGICGQAAGKRQTIIVPDVRADDRYLACSPFTRSEIVVPIISAGGVFGVLDVDSNDLDAFKEEDRRMLEDAAARIAERL